MGHASVVVEHGDAIAIPLSNASIDVVLSDLPFGRQHGSPMANKILYPRILSEIARVLHREGRAVLLTGVESHEVLLSSAVNSVFTVVATATLPLGEPGAKLVCLGRSVSPPSAFNLKLLKKLCGADMHHILARWRQAVPPLKPVVL